MASRTKEAMGADAHAPERNISSWVFLCRALDMSAGVAIFMKRELRPFSSLMLERAGEILFSKEEIFPPE
jgi:hypothetical protein